MKNGRLCVLFWDLGDFDRRQGRGEGLILIVGVLTNAPSFNWGN